MSQTDPMGDAPKEPETSTDAGMQDLEVPAAQAIPSAAPAAPAAAPSAPSGPRVFPQHFTLLLGTTAISLGCLGIWERAAICGADMRGVESISGSFVFLFGVYSFVVAVLNILQGRLRVGSAALAGFLALYVAIREIIRIAGLEAFRGFGDLEKNYPVIQERAEVFLGQIGPGLYLTLFGGLMIIWIFLKALVSKGPAQPAAAASPRRARR